jgi:hypothetical protein
MTKTGGLGDVYVYLALQPMTWCDRYRRSGECLRVFASTADGLEYPEQCTSPIQLYIIPCYVLFGFNVFYYSYRDKSLKLQPAL